MSIRSPARTKYRKSMKGSRAGNAKRGNTLAFGEFGLQSLSRGPMTGQQIEAARVTIARHLKRKGKLWIRVFPHKPVTKKPAEVRMGQGKGPVEFYEGESVAALGIASAGAFHRLAVFGAGGRESRHGSRGR